MQVEATTGKNEGGSATCTSESRKPSVAISSAANDFSGLGPGTDIL
jgi:hypothetical protein